MKSRWRAVLISVLVACLLSAPLILTGCSKPVQSSKAAVVQYIPPAYYNCTETNATDLINAYFSHYNSVAGAENVLNGHVFVFKNVVIQSSALKYATDTYIWVNGIIQCYFLTPGSAAELKDGDVVDVVGIDAGVCKDYSGTLVFNGCIFLPAGSVQLPAPGQGGANIPGY